MNAIVSIKQPKVRLVDALEYAGNQASLARILNISRPSVNAWVSEKRQFLPDLQAYRLVSINPDLNFDDD